MARERKILCAGVAAVVILLCACRSVPSRLFTLEPVMPTLIANAYGGPPIRIDAVHIPPALDRIEMMTEIAAGEYKVSDVDRWAAPLGPLARQALSADLVARLSSERVIFPGLMKPEGTIGITVDVIAWHAYGDSAQLQASWVGSPGGSPSNVCRSTVALRTTLSGTGSVALARAFSVLLGQLADGIAAQLGETAQSCL